MKTITPYLLKFAAVAILLTIVFRYYLSYGIANASAVIIVLTAVFYGICMFIAGWHFGKRDREHLPIHDVGFRFHLVTYLAHNLISELWFLLGFNSSAESVSMIHTTAIIWGIFLLCHFMFYLSAGKSAINNLHREDLFE